jgi:hypothetical protein
VGDLGVDGTKVKMERWGVASSDWFEVLEDEVH